MNSFWNGYIIFIVLLNIFGALWLLSWSRKTKIPNVQDNESLGHDFDGIQELNTPLPRWWLWLFYLTIVFAFIYLALFPGLGNFKGYLGWSSQSQWQAEVDKHESQYGPLFESLAAQPLEELAKDEKALKIGQRLFANNCAGCHGSDGRGSVGFPNLADNAWLYGGAADTIKMSIMNGRNGNMPPMGAALGGEEGVKAVATYVLSLSGRKVDSALASQGESKFKMICGACHGMEGTGNTMLGAPNLTDSDWLYGGSLNTIIETINNGRSGVMPAHKDLLGEEKVHIIAAYVYSLSQQ